MEKLRCYFNLGLKLFDKILFVLQIEKDMKKFQEHKKQF